MAERQRRPAGEILLLIALIALAGGLRASYLISCADNAHNEGPLRVETPQQLDTRVQKLRSPASNEEKEIAQVSPGYPYLLALVGRLGEETAPTMRWLQCGLGALTAGFYFLFARRVFRSSLVALLTGLLCALHPFWILDTPTLADGVTATFLLSVVLFFGVRASQTSGPLSSLLYGLALAALALVRAALLPFAFVALAWFLLRCRKLPRGWLAALLAFLGFVNGLAPWAIRCWQQFGEPRPLVMSTYYHLWLGNQPQQSPQAPDEPNTSSSAATLEEQYADEMLRQTRDHPAEIVRRRLRAGLDFLCGERWFTEGRLALSTGAEANMPPWLAGSYAVILESALLLLVVLGLLGWRWTYAWRFRAMPSVLALLWIPLPYLLSHAEALSGPRLPLDGVLLCYAAFVLACLFPARRALWAGEPTSGGDVHSPTV
jgi:4-amino-4-deoxy-L-arabinose transferase-like glycosyltransferase